MQAPVLDTDRLIIKPLTMEDGVVLFKYRADERVYRYQCWLPVDEAEAADFIRSYSCHDFGIPGTWFQLGLYLKSTCELIGDIGVHFLDEQGKHVEIGFTVSPVFQRRGYAFEALCEVLKYLFETMGNLKVTASIDLRNTASIALVEKLGMRKEALLRASQWCRGEWVDDVIYAILRDEWTP